MILLLQCPLETPVETDGAAGVKTDASLTPEDFDVAWQRINESKMRYHLVNMLNKRCEFSILRHQT